MSEADWNEADWNWMACIMAAWLRECACLAA